LKKGASTDDSTGLAAHLLALTLASGLTDEVLPPLKKVASIDNFTGLAAHLPASTLASRLIGEVLTPLKKGASIDNSTGLAAHLPASNLAKRFGCGFASIEKGSQHRQFYWPCCSFPRVVSCEPA
jgi:hypothetical protein